MHINSHLSVHTSFIKSCICARAMTLGLCCFGTVFRLHRYTHSRPQSPSFLGHVVGKRGSRVALGTRMRYTNLVYVHFNLFIDPTINSYTNPCNLASSRLLWVWLPCDKSHPREIRETGKDWFGKLSVPSLSRKFSFIPLCMHGGYVGSFLLSIKLIISFLFFNKKNWCMTRYRQTKVFFARVYTM